MATAAIDPERALRSIPSLVKAYLRLGGAVGEGACVDEAFNTVDVFMTMDTAPVAERYRAYLARADGQLS